MFEKPKMISYFLDYQLMWSN